MRFYIDSNVLISYIKQESGGFLRFQAERTKDFLMLSGKLKHTLILSDMTYTEIQRIAYLTQGEVDEVLHASDISIETVCSSKDDAQKAWGMEMETGTHYSDCLHTVLALKSRADSIITWNIKDFERASKSIAIRTPEEIISSLSP